VWLLAGIGAAALLMAQFDRSCHEHKSKCAPPLVQVEKKVGNKIAAIVRHVRAAPKPEGDK